MCFRPTALRRWNFSRLLRVRVSHALITGVLKRFWSSSCAHGKKQARNVPGRTYKHEHFLIPRTVWMSWSSNTLWMENCVYLMMCKILSGLKVCLVPLGTWCFSRPCLSKPGLSTSKKQGWSVKGDCLFPVLHTRPDHFISDKDGEKNSYRINKTKGRDGKYTQNPLSSPDNTILSTYIYPCSFYLHHGCILLNI